MTEERLQIARQLIAEQLAAGHIKPSVSPWNTPIFVIPKKSGKWRLLHDLRKVNAQMQTMGALQPGMPSPSMLPSGWHILIVDLKDCFFTIPLHPQDTQRFAFSIPAVKKASPVDRYEWVVLPQGMKNSPTLCQLYVAWALQPLRSQWPETIIYHYMDDILCCQKEPFTDESLWQLTDILSKKGLVIAPEKVQRTAPWKYLGWSIIDSKIRPQKTEIATQLRTLTDVQTLLGDVQWVRTCVGISNTDIAPLTELLRGNHPADSVILTPVQQAALQRIAQKLQSTWSSRRLLLLAISLLICNTKESPYAVICQWQNRKEDVNPPAAPEGDATDKCEGKRTKEDMFHILEWVFLGVQPKTSIQTRTEAIGELIRKGRSQIIEISGKEPEDISIPVNAGHLEWWLRNDIAIQEALLGYSGRVHSQQPQGKLWQVLKRNQWIEKPKVRGDPLSDGITVYTDAGRRLRRAACVWQEKGQWCQHIINGDTQDSLQTLELTAVVWALNNWLNVPLNVVTDSLYVAGVVPRLEDALLRETVNHRLGSLFIQMRSVLDQRTAACCVVHIRSHQSNLGLGQGNQLADSLVSSACHVPPTDKFQQARQSHENFHQNAKGLKRQFNLTNSEARGIIQACPKCGNHGPGIGVGVNPKGLKALELWQTDVTHISEFGRLRYVHVTIDTFSKMVWATALPGEKAHHICKHLLACFAVLGVPERIKTNNGPAYVSQKVRAFLQRWGVEHTTGIPHSPTGQGLVERMHQVLKDYLDRQKGIEMDVQQRLHRVLFTLNFLCLMGDREEPPVIVHHQNLKFNSATIIPQLKVVYRDPVSGIWMGPVPVIFNGRGYMCVSTDHGPVWVPSRSVKPALTQQDPPDNQDAQDPDPRDDDPDGISSLQD